MERKTILSILQANNKRNLKLENLDMAKKGQSYERNIIFFDSCTKQRHKNYYSKAILDSFLVSWVLWHINLCRLFNAKSILM